MSDHLAKEKGARLLKKRASVSSIEYRRSSVGSYDVRAKDKTKDSTTVSYMDDPGHHDDNTRVQMENTYQTAPSKRFPIAMATEILRDVLTSYLQEEQYEADLCRQMTKTICEVIKARVKELMIPRYKIIVQVNIGQLNDQNMRIVSRCLWDASSDNYASYTFKNSSLFAVANVYTVYFE